jgi:hypothetical protein
MWHYTNRIWIFLFFTKRGHFLTSFDLMEIDWQNPISSSFRWRNLITIIILVIIILFLLLLLLFNCEECRRNNKLSAVQNHDINTVCYYKSFDSYFISEWPVNCCLCFVRQRFKCDNAYASYNSIFYVLIFFFFPLPRRRKTRTKFTKFPSFFLYIVRIWHLSDAVII